MKGGKLSLRRAEAGKSCRTFGGVEGGETGRGGALGRGRKEMLLNGVDGGWGGDGRRGDEQVERSNCKKEENERLRIQRKKVEKGLCVKKGKEKLGKVGIEDIDDFIAGIEVKITVEEKRKRREEDGRFWDEERKGENGKEELGKGSKEEEIGGGESEAWRSREEWKQGEQNKG